MSTIKELNKTATSYHLANDPAACLASSTLALTKDPSNAIANRNRAWALFALRQYKDSRQACLVALGNRAKWRPAVRANMIALSRASSLLAVLIKEHPGESPTDSLRADWYEQRLRGLVATGDLRLLPPPRGFTYYNSTTDPNVLALAWKNLVERELSATTKTTTTASITTPLPNDTDGAGPLTCALVVRLDRSTPRHTGAIGACEGWSDEMFGGDGGERDIPAHVLDLYRFPFDQTTGGNLYRHHAPPIPFSCNTLLQDPSLRRRSCHATSGPCRECVRKMFPCPAFVFPSFDCRPPSSPLAASISSLDPHLDVFTSKALVSPATTSFLRDKLDKLGLSRKNSPAPKYHNIIDPNVGSVDGVWVPTDVSVSGVYVLERSRYQCDPDVGVLIELACRTSTGRMLPPGFVNLIASFNEAAPNCARCQIRSAIPDLNPHSHAGLYVAIEEVFEASLPLLAKLRRPALLLPGPLQVVVKAQRIVLDEGETYEGIWHEDGMNESVVAVVLYYYRKSPTLVGGAMEFASKHRTAMWTGDGGGEVLDEEGATLFRDTLPRGKVGAEEGTLLVFSNYAAVHRVLRMEAMGGAGSRDFLAFFVIDQRTPLSRRDLGESDMQERVAESFVMLKEQLKPRGHFGLEWDTVYSTGNGAVWDVGWMAEDGNGSALNDLGIGDRDNVASQGASIVDRLNFHPPALRRGVSYYDGLPAFGTDGGGFSASANYSQHVIIRHHHYAIYDQSGDVVNLPHELIIYANWEDFSYSLEAPREGWKEVVVWEDGLDDFKVTFLEEHGLYTRDEELRKTVEVGDGIFD